MAARFVPILLCVVALGGCHGTLFDLDSTEDGGAADLTASRVDLSGPPVQVTYTTFIQADLDSLGCTNSACHAGTAPMHVTANAATAAALLANYNEVKSRAQSGAMSLLLTKALQGSGVSHAGLEPFASTADPIYQRWLGWINDGAPFQPTAATDGGAGDGATP